MKKRIILFTGLSLVFIALSGYATLQPINGEVYIPSTDIGKIPQRPLSFQNNNNSSPQVFTNVTDSNSSINLAMSEQESQQQRAQQINSTPQASNQIYHTNFISLSNNNTGSTSHNGYGPSDLCKIVGMSSDYTATASHGIVAIISAGNNPSLLNNANVYSDYYNLPEMQAVTYTTDNKGNINTILNSKNKTVDFSKTSTQPMLLQVTDYQGNTDMKSDDLTGVQQECDLDVEMVHAMSPNANIVVFYAMDMADKSIDQAISDAAKFVSAQGGGEVSISLGTDVGYNANNSGAYTGDQKAVSGSYNNVIFVASTGDDGYFCSTPACQSNVISAGGASIPSVSDLSSVATWNEIFISVYKVIYTPSENSDGKAYLSPTSVSLVTQAVENNITDLNKDIANNYPQYLPDKTYLYDPIGNIYYKYDAKNQVYYGYDVVVGDGINADPDVTNGVIGNGRVWAGNGGFSLIGSTPSYQTLLSSLYFNSLFTNGMNEGSYQLSANDLPNFRATPDLSFDSAASTGVAVYDNNEWVVDGGTSVSAPALAGIINTVCSQPMNTQTVLKNLYNNAQFAKTASQYYTPVLNGEVDYNITKNSDNNYVSSYTRYADTSDIGYSLASGLGIPKNIQCFNAN